ncbi:hypothetical protein MHZ92_07520 [Sporosarcina sp. ACRSL]|uniref:hypothetical protein n=1 Tax=Sporosarcina sp. ACRSL TaxID=2918215 RepID=UPI001EF4633B|nr:hypothetical protein [Sporosarcina sp. ACRSL]MCG7343976.1 hypothetical protein [Sporosarcina sp. ACRSL]
MSEVTLDGGSLTVSSLTNIDLNNKTVIGDLEFTTTDPGTITLAAGTLKGNLVVNTPNVHFINNATVTGTTTINGVTSTSFVNNGSLKAVEIKDDDGARFVNNGTVTALKVNTPAKVVFEKAVDKSLPTIEVDSSLTTAEIVAPAGTKIEAYSNTTVNAKTPTGDELSVVDSEGDVKEAAAKFTSTTVKVEDQKLVLPTIDEGFTLAMVSSNTNVIANDAKNGAAVNFASENGEPATVNLTFTVSKDGKEAKTTVDVNVESFLGLTGEQVTSLNVANVTEAEAKFLVKGLEFDYNGKMIEKPSTLAEVKDYIDETYDVNFNTDAIKVTNGKIEITGQVLSTDDWKKVKANGKFNIPYRITLVKDTTNIGVAKVAMYQDGKATLEEIK